MAPRRRRHGKARGQPLRSPDRQTQDYYLSWSFHEGWGANLGQSEEEFRGFSRDGLAAATSATPRVSSAAGRSAGARGSAAENQGSQFRSQAGQRTGRSARAGTPLGRGRGAPDSRGARVRPPSAGSDRARPFIDVP